MAETAALIERSAELRIAVIGSNAARREALARHLEDLGYTVVEEARADVVLADGDAALPDVPAIVLGGVASDAAGVLPADANLDQIDAALRAVAAGLSVRPIRHRETNFAALEEMEAGALLTPREIEVLIALSNGLSNKAVARKLEISQHTVKFHVESVFRKLGVTTRAEAVAKGLRQGLVHL